MWYMLFTWVAIGFAAFMHDLETYNTPSEAIFVLIMSLLFGPSAWAFTSKCY